MPRPNRQQCDYHNSWNKPSCCLYRRPEAGEYVLPRPSQKEYIKIIEESNAYYDGRRFWRWVAWIAIVICIWQALT